MTAAEWRAKIDSAMKAVLEKRQRLRDGIEAMDEVLKAANKILKREKERHA